MGSDSDGSHDKANTQQGGISSAEQPPIEIEKQIDSSEHRNKNKNQAAITNQALVDRIDRSDRWIIGLTAVIAVGGIVSAIIFGKQLTVMQGQLDSMEADQRAWVFISSVDIAHDLIFADGRAFVTTKFQLKNAGRTPAKFAVVTGEFIMRGGTAEDVKKGWDTCDKARTKPEIELLAGTAVFPGQEVPQSMWFGM